MDHRKRHARDDRGAPREYVLQHRYCYLYIWVVTNNKSEDRRGNVQLIDAQSTFSPLRKALGKKRSYISDAQQADILTLYKNRITNDTSKILPNSYFGYTKVVVEQPLEADGDDLFGKEHKPDPTKRDYERIPLGEDIEEFFDREVKPHLPYAWLDRSQDKIGYEINFNKIFYTFKPLRDPDEILDELRDVAAASEALGAELAIELQHLTSKQ